MNGTDRIVEFIQKVVRIIERPVRENIHFGGFQDADAVEALIQLSMKRICFQRSSTETPLAIFRLCE